MNDHDGKILSQKYPCPYCRMGCYTAELLANHVRYAHKVEEDQLCADVLEALNDLEES